MERYNSYNRFLQDKFGTRVHKVPVNAGFTCPNRDGKVATGGCSYCNIDSFTPEAARARIPIRQQVSNGIAYLKRRTKAKAFIVYFQPYSNTYATLDRLIPLYEEALDHPEVVGISVGTRPDCVEEEKLLFFRDLARRYFVTIEFGIESIFDETLASINRGHDYRCTVDAITRTAAHGLHICGHLIFGFPSETRDMMLQTVQDVSMLPLHNVKLHNLHVVRHTRLAAEYAEKPFHIFTFEEWVRFVCDTVERLNPNFIVERLYGDAPKDLLIAPDWCRNRSQIIDAIRQELDRRDTHQGSLYNPKTQEAITA